MIASSLRSVTLALVAILCATSTQAQDQQQQTAQQFHTAMLNAVNRERAAQGLPAFCFNKKLQAAAQRHSNDQAQNNFMSHTGSDGSSMSQRVTAQGFKWSSVAENVAAGQVDVASVMQSWMNSDGHRRNILGGFKYFGMGYTYSASTTYKHYWTQDFGASDGETCDGEGSTAPAPTPAATTVTSKPVTSKPVYTPAPPVTQSPVDQRPRPTKAAPVVTTKPTIRSEPATPSPSKPHHKKTDCKSSF